jgi:hypothetical protein
MVLKLVPRLAVSLLVFVFFGALKLAARLNSRYAASWQQAGNICTGGVG